MTNFRAQESRLIDPRTLVLVAMIAAAAATRFIPVFTGMWNFTSVGAVCLFGGAYFTRRWSALLVPMAAMLISDVLLYAFVYEFESVQKVIQEMWMSYVLFGLTVGLGMLLRGRLRFDSLSSATTSTAAVMGTAVAASLMFFLLSNGQYWLTSGRYPLTMAGLLECYALALPFAKSMLYGNLLYTPLLFGSFELLSSQWPALSLRPAGELVPLRA